MNTGRSAPAVVIVLGKFVGVGVTAFIFDVTRTKLLADGVVQEGLSNSS